MDLLSIEQAQAYFTRIPVASQIVTQSPAYVLADSARDKALEPLFIGCETDKGVWLHSVHKCAIPDSPYADFQSPYGYGGPVTSITDPAELLRLWSTYTTWCADHSILIEFIRFHPLANPEAVYHGRIMPDRMCVVIPLQVLDIRSGYEVRCRTAVRKAEKGGVVVRELPRDAIPSNFAEFYRKGMRMIGAKPFYLFDDRYFEALASISPMKLLVAEKDGEWCAAALFFTGPSVWEYHLSAATPEGRSLSAANLLIDQAAHQGRDAGADLLFLGGGTDRAPENPLLFSRPAFPR